jgi:hypothetical protein
MGWEIHGQVYMEDLRRIAKGGQGGQQWKGGKRRMERRLGMTDEGIRGRRTDGARVKRTLSFQTL